MQFCVPTISSSADWLSVEGRDAKGQTLQQGTAARFASPPPPPPKLLTGMQCVKAARACERQVTTGSEVQLELLNFFLLLFCCAIAGKRP